MGGTITSASRAGVAERLAGVGMPDLRLPATDGDLVDLSRGGLTVVYAYSRTSLTDGVALDGWDAIPGARGCTPQSCAFRDHFADFRALGVERLFGLSTQDTDDQREAAERLHLPFTLLSDAGLDLSRALDLPLFEAGGLTLIERLTLVIVGGRIEKVFHPVPSPAANASDVTTAACPRIGASTPRWPSWRPLSRAGTGR